MLSGVDSQLTRSVQLDEREGADNQTSIATRTRRVPIRGLQFVQETIVLHIVARTLSWTTRRRTDLFPCSSNNPKPNCHLPEDRATFGVAANAQDTLIKCHIAQPEAKIPRTMFVPLVVVRALAVHHWTEHVRVSMAKAHAVARLCDSWIS